jgi:hypothetical protein
LCDLRTRLVGDGCEVCNPELAEELRLEAAEAAFEVWVSKFDTTSNQYLDMGANEYFIAGYLAALEERL